MRAHRLILALLFILSPLHAAGAWDDQQSSWNTGSSYSASTTSSYAPSATLPSLFHQEEEPQHQPTYADEQTSQMASTDQGGAHMPLQTQRHHIMIDEATFQCMFETTIKQIESEHAKDWETILNGPDDISVAFQTNFTAFRISLLNEKTQNSYIQKYIQDQFTQIFEHYEGRGIATNAFTAVRLHTSRSKSMMDALITLSLTLQISLPMEIHVKYDWVNYKISGKTAATYFATTKKRYGKKTKAYIEQFFIYLGQRNAEDRSTANKIACFFGAKTSATQDCAIYLISLCLSSKSQYKFPAKFLKEHLSFLYESQYEDIKES